MRLTNALGWPAWRLRLAAIDDYSGPRPGPLERVVSVTSLVGPPRLAVLARTHRDLLEEDVSGTTWRSLGSALHLLASRAQEGVPEVLSEVRLTAGRAGWDVTGALDLLDEDRILWDIKVTSVFAIADGPKPEWIAQLNLLAWLLEENGARPVTGLKNWAVLYDWNQREVERSGYPSAREVALEVPRWTRVQTLDYLDARLADLERARNGDPRDCSEEERWASPGSFAVYKGESRKRAARVLDSYVEAHAWAAEQGLRNAAIVERLPESRRCAQYCAVAAFCPQRQKELVDAS